MNARTTALLAIALVGCAPPPPAPEGLDDTTKYLMRNFWSDDAIFQAGIQGFYDWFETGGGKELVGACAGDGCVGTESKPTDAFTIEDLTDEDVAIYPLDDELVDDPGDDEGPEDDVLGPRGIERAAGVVSLAEMDCDWLEAEDLLVRRDQDTVFAGDWEDYVRTYVNNRDVFQAASRSGAFDAIPEAIDPYADGFDPAAYGGSILITENMADPTPLIGVDVPAYPLALEFRHGTWDIVIDDEPLTVSGFAIVTYNAEAVWAPGGENGLRQSFSIEIALERPGDKTLRMLAVWAEPVSPIIDADAAFTLNYAVNKSLKSSEKLSKICGGEEDVPAEPAE